RDFLGDKLGAVVNDERAVEIHGVVYAVFNLVPVPVNVAPLRPVAMNVHINVNLDDLVRGEEAVFNALPERVCVNRRTEIVDVRDILGFLRRGGESDLGGAREIIENLFPRRIVGRAATMALVNDNEIEKAGREFPEKFLALLRP